MPPPKTALLVIDMQVFFRPMCTKAIPEIQTLLSLFSLPDNLSPGPIIFTQHGHTKAELKTYNSPSQLVRKWGVNGSIAEGSADWEIQKEFEEWAPKSEKGIVEGGRTGESLKSRRVKKNTYDAFINTDLESILREEEVVRVIITGVMVGIAANSGGPLFRSLIFHGV